MSAVCCVPCARRKAHKLVYENNGQIDEERGDHGRRHSVSDRNECQGKAQQRAHVGPGVNVTGFKTPTQTRLAALVQWAERRRCEALTGALRAEPRPYGKHRETRLWASGYEPAIPCRTVLSCGLTFVAFQPPTKPLPAHDSSLRPLLGAVG
jgi:hypothetical protein